MNKRCILAFAIGLLSLQCVRADDNILRNGDFENNFANTSLIDTTNSQFTIRMPQLEAFGDREGIDIYTVGSFSNPQSGDWNVALKAGEDADSEAFSFSMRGQLDPAETYRLEFYAKPLIGVLHSGGTIEIGLSTNPDEFGVLIFESTEDGLGWAKYEVTFEAPYFADFLTVRVNNGGDHWVAVDNFRLTHVQGDLLLNGSFEDIIYDASGIEDISVANADFNMILDSVTAFGSDHGMDILNGLVGEFPVHGNRKIIGGGPEVAIGDFEQFSFEMIEPVLGLQLYYLEFFQERVPGFGAVTGGTVQIGLSNTPDTFGIQIYESPVATPGWDRVATNILVPIAATYLTVRFAPGDDGYIGVDAFSLRPFLLGDINFDSEVNLLDVQPFVEVVSEGEFLAEADVNMDGTVDLLDVGAFVDLMVN